MPKIVTLKHASLFVLLALSATFACKREHGLSRECNLDFVVAADGKLPAWLKLYRTQMKMETDSSQLVQGKPSLKIGPMEFLSQRWPLKANLQQRILIPRLGTDSATISLTGKSRKLEVARLLVSGFDENEDRLYSNGRSCLSRNKWQTFSITVPVKDVVFLHMELQAGGRDSNAAWWLDRIRILMDGRDIGDLSGFTGYETASLTKTKVVPLSFECREPYTAIPELTGTKLLAIGESVHGSATVNKAAVQLIKQQVAGNNARLVVLEMPFAQLLSYNRFIQGDPAFKIDSLLIDYHSLVSKNQLTDLLLWLKRYNDSAEEKVWLMGMDIDTSPISSAMWLFDYFYTLNQCQPHPVFESLCAELVKTDRSFEKMKRLLESSKDIESLTGEKEYQILMYCLGMNGRTSSRTSGRKTVRDSMMFENSKLLVDVLASGTKKAVFYAHLSHTNYRTLSTTFLSPSFGAYMKKKFGNDYSNIAILVGDGSVLIREGDSLLEKQLQSPPPNSLERLLSRQEESYFYTPAMLGVAQLRELGATYTAGREFGTMTLQPRMDGIIFIRNSEAALPENDDVSYLRSFPVRKFMKNFERNKLLQTY